MTAPTRPSSVMNTYARQAIAFERGEGVWLFDEDSNQYMDALSGIAVCNLGHCHPKVTQAIQQQSARLVHTSNVYQVRLQEQLAEKLCRMSGMERVFFGNSGAEANECAIKLARLHGHHKQIESANIIVFDNAFHGRTLATLSATAGRSVHAGFEPLVSGFIRAPFNDIEALRNIAKNTPSVAAILMEPIQGEGGIHVPEPGYLAQVRQLCDDYDLLMILDEIQSGNGRTGTYFNFQQSSAKPDIVTTAKGLANGFPIGACLAQGAAARLFVPGNHGSTYGGNPLGCAAALAVLNVLNDEQLFENAQVMGERIRQRFEAKIGQCDYVKDIRGQGLMIGIELDRPCAELVSLALHNRILINVTAGSVMRLLPPLIVNAEQADTMVDGLCELIAEFMINSSIPSGA